METVLRVDLMHHNNVRMAQLGEDSGLAHKARDAIGRDELGPEHFDGHEAIECGLASEVHHSHTAASKLAKQLVVRCYCSADALEQGGHRSPRARTSAP